MQNTNIIWVIVFLAVMGCASSKAVAQATDDDPAPQVAESPLEGTWQAQDPTSLKWIITNGKLRMYLDGEHLDNGAVYTYKITKDGKQCGYDLNDRLARFPLESILVLRPLYSSEQKCYLIAYDSQRFTVFPYTSKYPYTFKKQ